MSPAEAMAAKASEGSLSVNAFAARLGVDEKAVRKAIRNGRIEHGLRREANGRVTIVDALLAEQDWARNKDESKVRGAGGSIGEERRRLLQAQRRKVNLYLRERRGDLIPRRAMEIRFATRVVTARTKLLGIPSRAKQRLPHLTTADLGVLEDLIREALDELGEARDE